MKKILLLILVVLFGTLIFSCNESEKAKDYTTRSTKYLKSYFYDGEVFHDQASEYMSPLEPKSTDTVTLTLKCRYGQTKEAKVWVTTNAENPVFVSYDLSFVKADINFSYEYWEVTIPQMSATYYYHFSLENEKELIYYTKNGIQETQQESIDGDWVVMPDFTTPDWAKGTVWYSIMPDSYANGNVLNDKTGTYSNAWGTYHNGMSGYFGGDIQGIYENIDYIKSLGAESIFVNPIWVTTHQAGYGSFDFSQYDSTFGSDTEVKTFINALHDNSMYIMFDAVFQYCNASNIWNNSSPIYPILIKSYSAKPGDEYYDFLQRDSSGNVIMSTWGSPCIDFSSEITREVLYQNADSIMQYFITEFDIDGWRMDVGNSLTGTDENNFGTSTDILTDMRSYIKATDEDVLFLSEHADGDQFDYCLDSKWNYTFGYAIRDWAMGLSNPSVLMNSIESGVLGLPRSVANASYNFLTTHDLTRFIDIIDTSGFDNATTTSVFNAAQQLQFTFVGSPSIFYGEEIGMSKSNVINNTTSSPFFNSMIWNDVDINYDIYYRTKALGELRSSYERLFKDGAYLRLYAESANNPNGLIAFARFNEEGSVISVINPTNNYQTGFELDVSLLSLKDGSTVYDYYTGKEYIVKNGKITIDVYSGGVIITDKKIESEYLGYYRQSLIQNANANVTLGNGINEVVFNGNGSIEGTADAINFVYKEGFNNITLSSKVNVASKGQAVLLIRSSLDSDGAFFGVLISNNKIRVFSRNNKGTEITYGQSYSITSSDIISITRASNNKFYCLVNGNIISEGVIDAGYYLYAGATILSGQATFTDLIMEENDAQMACDFTDNIGSLAYFADGNYYETTDGELILNGNTSLVIPYKTSDFTFKTKVKLNSSISNDYAGLKLGYEDTYTSLTINNIDGKYYVVLANVINGDKVIITQEEVTTDDIILQVERVGQDIYGYIINGNNHTLVGKTSVNYSKIDLGLISNNNKAAFDYISFGDMINQETNYADFSSNKDIDFTLIESTNTAKYSALGGDYEFVKGGIKQNNNTLENTVYGYTNNSLANFTATFTLNMSFLNDTSYVGAVWGASSSGGVDGFKMLINKTGKVSIVNKDGECLGTYQINNFKENEDYNFIIKNENNHLTIYLNDDPKKIIDIENAAKNGYFAFIGSYSTYSLKSYGIYTDAPNYMVYEGSLNTYINEYDADLVDLEICGGDNNLGYICLRDCKVSNFILGTNLQMTRTNMISRGYVRFAIGNTFGGNSLKGGLVVQINDKAQLTIYENGNIVKDASGNEIKNIQLDTIKVTSCYLIISYIGNELKLYGAPYKTTEKYDYRDIVELYSYTDTIHRSGVLSFYSQNATVRLGMIRACRIDSGDDVYTEPIFNNYFVTKELPGEPTIIAAEYKETYSVDFSDSQTLGDFTRYSGAVSIKGGNLIVDGTNGNNWDAGAGLAVGKFTNYKLTTRVKIKNGYGWGAIEINKTAVNVNHQQSSLTIMLTQQGGELFLGNDVKYTTLDGVEKPINIQTDSEGYINVTIINCNGLLSINLGDPNSTLVCRIADLTRNNTLTSGYISLNSGSNVIYYDYLTIEPGEYDIKLVDNYQSELLTSNYNNDFSSNTKGFLSYGGELSIVDGSMLIDGTGNWNAGAAFTEGTFKNFELTLKVKIDDTEKWAAIEFNKASAETNHENKAITLLIFQGKANLYLGQNVSQEGSEVNCVKDEDGYITVHLSVINGVITYNCGDNSYSINIASLARNNDLVQGYISLNAGSVKAYFDDLSIVIK